ncbi:MAG TPA: hypothetical protein VN923_16045, partial [Thermoanaerobaculia bacterium]|nr:hypothetical protein [Thermoanaerobaculia bacterium]
MPALVTVPFMIRDPPLLLALLALCLLLVWAPMPFGSVGYEARALLQAGCGVALVLAVLSRRDGERDGELGAGAKVPALALLLVAGWGVVQTLQLPAAWVRAISPRAAELRATAAALAGAPRPARMPLSLAPDLSVSNALWWTAVAAALLAAALVARERAARRAIGLSLLVAAGFEVVYGSRRGTASTAEIWGTEVPTAT